MNWWRVEEILLLGELKRELDAGCPMYWKVKPKQLFMTALALKVLQNDRDKVEKLNLEVGNGHS